MTAFSKWLERTLSWWVSFGLLYCIFRWVFDVGHLAAALAYFQASVGTALIYIERAVRGR